MAGSKAYLDVAVQSLVYTYEVELLTAPVRVVELRDGRIEADKVELELYTSPTDPALDDQFLFWDSPAQVGPEPAELGKAFSLPARVRWEPSDRHASPVSSSGRIITGRIERRGVSGQRMYDGDDTCVWRIDVESVAERLLEEQLEQIDFGRKDTIEALQAETSLHRATSVIYERTGDVDKNFDLRTWDVRGLLDWALGRVDILTEIDLTGIFRLDVRYLNAEDVPTRYRRDDIPVGIAQLEKLQFVDEPGGAPIYDATSTTLPEITALDLWSDLVDLHGWIVDVEHAPWPSEAIHLRTRDPVLPNGGRLDDGIDVSSLSSMTWTQDGYEVYHEEPLQPDFALKYRNDLEQVIVDAQRREYPLSAKYSAVQRRINGDWEAYNDTVRTIAFRLPDSINSAESPWNDPFDDGDYSESVRGAGVIVNDDVGNDIYLFELYDDAGTWRNVLYRVPERPAGPSGGVPAQDEAVGAIHLRERFPSHAIHVLSRRVLEGEGDLVAWVNETQSPWEMRPGSFAEQLEGNSGNHALAHEGMVWVPERIEWDYERDTAQLVLVYPHRFDLRTAQDPESQPFDPPPVQAEKETEEYVDDQDRYLRVVWVVRVVDAPSPPPGASLEIRTLDSAGDVVLAPTDFGGSTSWVEIWEAGDPPPLTPPPTPAAYDDSEDVQARFRDDATGDTTAWSTLDGILDLGTTTILVQ